MWLTTMSKESIMYIMIKRALNNKTEFERKLDNINHTMELIRTIVPLIMVGLQLVILYKLLD